MYVVVVYFDIVLFLSRETFYNIMQWKKMFRIVSFNLSLKWGLENKFHIFGHECVNPNGRPIR